MWKKIKPYVLHLRPRSFLIVFFHMFSGLFLGMLMIKHFNLDLIKLIIGFFTWVVCLNGATLAINSYYDKDEGAVGWLENPPRIPKYLNVFSWTLFAIGFILSSYINRKFFIAYTINFILSVLYSVPPFYWKRKTGFDLFVNALGYGVLTMYAGYSLLDVALTPQMIIILLVIFIMWGAGYPLTQIYQIEEDKNRGFKTLAIALGKKGSLIFSFILALLVLIILVISFILGYFSSRIFIMVPLFILGLVYLLNWYLKYKTINEKIEMYKGYLLMGLLDVFFIVIFF